MGLKRRVWEWNQSSQAFCYSSSPKAQTTGPRIASLSTVGLQRPPFDPIMTTSRKNLPMISVVIPTHNRSNLLPQALKSVLNQTYSSVEIIVVDDASAEGTQELLTGYGRNHGNIRILRNETAQGPCRSRNMGIEAARGELISFLDDDDEWLPDRLNKLAEAFEPIYAYICSDYWIKNAKGFSRQYLPKSITYHDMLYRNRTGNSVLADIESVRAVGGFDECLEARQDYDLWLRLLELSRDQKAQVI